jgi:glutaredoxin
MSSSNNPTPMEEMLSVGFTVYSKSGCPNCTKAKKRIQQHFFLHKVVDCDEYLIDDKEGFLSSIELRVGKRYTTFPMVFYDGRFLGGWAETEAFVDKLLLSFEENF